MISLKLKFSKTLLNKISHRLKVRVKAGEVVEDREVRFCEEVVRRRARVRRG